MKKNMKFMRVQSLVPQARNRMAGDPRSVFYGDPVEIDPEDAADAIGHEASAIDVPAQAIAADIPSEDAAAARVAAYQQLSDTERAQFTFLPPLATWNAFTIINPMLGRVSATSLNYMLLKSLNDYPFQGKTIAGDPVTDGSGHVTGHTVTINATSLFGEGPKRMVALPFFRFAIASSTLNARPGAQVTIDIEAEDPQGAKIDTKETGYSYSFQRLNSTEAIVGIFIPTVVVATRTLPFLAIAGQTGPTESPILKEIVIYFDGTGEGEQVSVTVPGYATSELKEIGQMYSLPAALIR